jgi:hypothetical protein
MVFDPTAFKTSKIWNELSLKPNNLIRRMPMIILIGMGIDNNENGMTTIKTIGYDTEDSNDIHSEKEEDAAWAETEKDAADGFE